MNIPFKFTIIALLAVLLFASSCSATKKSTCGCKGMVGY